MTEPAKLDLAAIQARADAATAGPWVKSQCDGKRSGTWWAVFRGAVAGTGIYKTSFQICRVLSMTLGAEDAAFIAHARTDVPLLIQRIRDLEALCAVLEVDSQAARIAELEKENAKLTSVYQSYVASLASIAGAVGNKNSDSEITLQIVRNYVAFACRVAKNEVGNEQAFDWRDFWRSVQRDAQRLGEDGDL